MTWVAAVQMASGPNVSANLGEAERLIAQAVDGGARLVVLPENFAHMSTGEGNWLAVRETDGSGRIQDFLAAQAARHGVWLVGGTIPLESPKTDRYRAACLVYDDSGQRVARYDKLHLFDVTVKAAVEERYAESSTIDPGSQPVVIDSPFGRIGLAVCYDLRFPELFRCMLDQGMEVITLPSAFTAVTGRAHWEVLVRARAVENLSYVIAAGQGGFHVGGRETFGNSMIVDPWGAILGQLPRGPGVIGADIDLERVASIRKTFPATEHRRLHCG